MTMLTDWHSHHMPPEIIEEFLRLTGRAPRIDPNDAPDFSRRIKEMAAARLDVEIVCQGASIFAKIAQLGLPIFLHGVSSSNDPSQKKLEDEEIGVIYSVIADAYVSECVVRMVAAGVFDRHPNLKIVIRSGGGGLHSYCIGSFGCIAMLDEGRIVFGSDYCGGLGSLEKTFAVIEEQPNPERNSRPLLLL